MMAMETTQLKQLRHAVARVAETRRLLPGAPKHYCQMLTDARAALSHFAYFKTLLSQAIKIAIYVSLSPAEHADFFSGCHDAIFPPWRRGLRGGAGENSLGVAVYDRAQKDAGHEDYKRTDTFLHTSPCFGVIYSEEGVGANYNLFWG